MRYWIRITSLICIVSLGSACAAESYDSDFEAQTEEKASKLVLVKQAWLLLWNGAKSKAGAAWKGTQGARTVVGTGVKKGFVVVGRGAWGGIKATGRWGARRYTDTAKFFGEIDPKVKLTLITSLAGAGVVAIFANQGGWGTRAKLPNGTEPVEATPGNIKTTEKSLNDANTAAQRAFVNACTAQAAAIKAQLNTAEAWQRKGLEGQLNAHIQMCDTAKCLAGQLPRTSTRCKQLLGNSAVPPLYDHQDHLAYNIALYNSFKFTSATIANNGWDRNQFITVNLAEFARNKAVNWCYLFGPAERMVYAGKAHRLTFDEILRVDSCVQEFGGWGANVTTMARKKWPKIVQEATQLASAPGTTLEVTAIASVPEANPTL